MNEELNNVNLDNIQKAIETITSMNHCINSSNLTSYFTEIETTIRQINFEHANCISNYKDTMNDIYEKIDELKENLNQLQDGLATTIQNFSAAGTNYRQTNTESAKLETSVTKVPPVTSQEPEIISSEPVEAQQTINTIPIGLGIAATGIAGSVGAIVLDSMNDHKKISLEQYKPTETIEDNTTPILKEKSDISIAPVFEDNTPYHASRNNEAMNKFYGSNITEYYEDEEEKD